MPHSVRYVVAASFVLAAGCAPRTPASVATVPALPATLAYPDFVYPDVPESLRATAAAAAIDLGWRHLQRDESSDAEAAFSSVLASNPGFAPAHTGRGYVALAEGDHARAVASFETALEQQARYAPALVGLGQSLLALERDADALAAFERALEADPSLTGLKGRVDLLRFRQVQAGIERARRAAGDGRFDEAREAYEAAIAASPESAFLHRELAAVERRAGRATEALARYRRAVELDPQDAGSLTAIGELLDQSGNLEGAREAFTRAHAIDPSTELTARLAALDARLRDAGLPPAVRDIAAAPQVTRAQLAALTGIRFADLLRRAPAKAIVMTDTRGHWAESWMQTVASAGLIEPFENHAFQPGTIVRRVDLAELVRRLTMLADPDRAELNLPATRRPAIADVSPRHLNYPAVSFAVASSLMPLQGGRFEVARPVSGAEVTEVLARVEELVRGAR